MTDVIRDEGDLALHALLSRVARPLPEPIREQVAALSQRHFGRGAEISLLEPGTMLGSYRIERVIGSGGQAVVYQARHLRLLARTVAVKVPHGAETSRMVREAAMMARLDHPGIVSVLDVGEDVATVALASDASGALDVHTTPYLVCEHMVGGSLQDRIEEQGALDDDEVIRIAKGLLEALAYAHAQGIVHRDLKPANILFDRADRPRIADFGIGKVVSEQVSLSLTSGSATAFAGTPLYMAPEQERPGGKIDQRTDLYAFGKLLYHMLTAIDPRTLKPIEQERQGLMPGWTDLIFALTATDPDRRPASADAVIPMIEALAKPPEERKEAQIAKLREVRQRLKIALRVSGLIAFVFLVLALVVVLATDVPTSEQKFAPVLTGVGVLAAAMVMGLVIAFAGTRQRLEDLGDGDKPDARKPAANAADRPSRVASGIWWRRSIPPAGDADQSAPRSRPSSAQNPDRIETLLRKVVAPIVTVIGISAFIGGAAAREQHKLFLPELLLGIAGMCIMGVSLGAVALRVRRGIRELREIDATKAREISTDSGGPAGVPSQHNSTTPSDAAG